jgi:predicted TIM-barrel fold metal-dependent hydrolase
VNSGPGDVRQLVLLPKGACDTHSHVYGPGSQFPYVADRAYEPVDVPIGAYRQMAERLGLQRAVFVQPVVHGTDHAALIDALTQGGGRFAGVGLIGFDISDAELERLDAAGMRGARFNYLPPLGRPPEPAAVRGLADRLARLGWHICVHLDVPMLRQHAAFLASLGCPVVIDHMARVRRDDPTFKDDFDYLVSLLARSELWVKISAADRTVPGPTRLAEAVSMLQRLYEAAPDRCLWGLDWPHPNVGWLPEDAMLLDLLLAAFPTPRERRRILVENPDRLYFRRTVADPTVAGAAR